MNDLLKPYVSSCVQFYNSLHTDAKKTLWYGAVLILPIAIFISGEATADHINGGRAILLWIDLEPDSIYVAESFPRDILEINPRERFGFVYLPPFAVLIGVIISPAFLSVTLLTEIGVQIPPWIDNLSRVAEVLLVGGFFYASHIGTALLGGRFFTNKYKQIAAISSVLLMPTLVWEIVKFGPNMFMTFLLLAGIHLVIRNHWFVAAFAIGFSTFKFTGAPFAVILFIISVWTKRRRPIIETILGGVVSQIPSIIYFFIYPTELMLIIQERGALASLSRRLYSGPYHSLIKTLEIQEWYMEIGFPLLLLLCTVIGALIAVKEPSAMGLLSGFAVGAFAIGFLIPSVQRITPFFILTILLVIGYGGKFQYPLLIIGTVDLFAFIVLHTYPGADIWGTNHVQLEIIPFPETSVLYIQFLIIPALCLYSIIHIVKNESTAMDWKADDDITYHRD